MTLIVGILCSDGVVVASDSFATYAAGAAPTIGQQHVDKVLKIGNDCIYASTGAVGMSQIVSAVIEQLQVAGVLTQPAIVGATKPSTEAMKVIASNIRAQVLPTLQAAAETVPLVGMQAAGATAMVKCLVAVAVNHKPCLFQFDYSGAPEEATAQLPFVALGSGQPLADPFLAFLKRVIWEDKQPTVAEGRLVAAWTVRHVSLTNFGGVGLPVQLATLTIGAAGAPVVMIGDPGEHDQAVLSAEAALRDYITKPAQAGGPAAAIPPQPPQAPPL